MSLDSINSVLIDMDGVLWRGDEPLPGLAAFFQALHARQMNFMLLTNNSTRTIADYVDKLSRFGAQVGSDQILTCAYATADWLAGQLQPGALVYTVGEAGLHTALKEAGFAVAYQDPPDKADAVVVGLFFGITYETIYHASRLAREGALFAATNADATFPYPGGLGPGAGSILAAISVAAGREPTVIGKPNTLMFEQALKRLNATPERTVMVGDRLNTDILGGQQAGLKTALVLTGVTKSEDLDGSEILPTWVYDDIVALTTTLNAK